MMMQQKETNHFIKTSLYLSPEIRRRRKTATTNGEAVMKMKKKTRELFQRNCNNY
jgi:hypothetical protein